MGLTVAKCVYRRKRVIPAGEKIRAGLQLFLVSQPRFRRFQQGRSKYSYKIYNAELDKGSRRPT